MQGLRSGFSPFGALRHHLCHGVKRVTRFSGRCAPLRIVFPCHPAVRGHNKAPQNTFLIGCSILSTGYCPTACGGKVVAPATKGGRRKAVYKLAPAERPPSLTIYPALPADWYLPSFPLLTILTEILRLRLRMTAPGGKKASRQRIANSTVSLSHCPTISLAHQLTSPLAH